MLVGIDTVFFFNDTATTEIYTLSLHDALPIYGQRAARTGARSLLGGLEDELDRARQGGAHVGEHLRQDRKSTRLNSSHANISYAVFCLKKKTHVILLIIALHLLQLHTALTTLS